MVPWVLSAIIFEFFQILIRSVYHNFPRIRAHFRVWVPINYYNLSVDGNHNLCFARPGQKCYLKYCSYSTIYWSMSIPVSNFISLIDKGQLISKCPFGVFKSPKEPKVHFKMNWPLQYYFFKLLEICINFHFFNFGLLLQLARVAQLVERQAFNLNVQGSSPCSGDILFANIFWSFLPIYFETWLTCLTWLIHTSFLPSKWNQ